jgi:hypothetical protein
LEYFNELGLKKKTCISNKNGITQLVIYYNYDLKNKLESKTYYKKSENCNKMPFFKTDFFSNGDLTYGFKINNNKNIEIISKNKNAVYYRVLDKDLKIQKLIIEKDKYNIKTEIEDPKEIKKSLYKVISMFKNPNGLMDSQGEFFCNAFLGNLKGDLSKFNVNPKTIEIKLNKQNKDLEFIKGYNYTKDNKPTILSIAIYNENCNSHALNIALEPNDLGGRNIAIIDTNGTRDNGNITYNLSIDSFKKLLDFDKNKDRIIFSEKPFQIDGTCGFCSHVIFNECVRKFIEGCSIYEDIKDFNNEEINDSSLLIKSAKYLYEAIGIKTCICLNYRALKILKSEINLLEKNYFSNKDFYQEGYVYEVKKCFDFVKDNFDKVNSNESLCGNLKILLRGVGLRSKIKDIEEKEKDFKKNCKRYIT